MKKLLIVGAVLMLAACSDEPTARRVLAQNGYSNIATTGYSWFGCSKGDTYSTGFEATAPGGQRVSGVVCSAWLKGATIRFN